jgi:hypothetical protein
MSTKCVPEVSTPRMVQDGGKNGKHLRPLLLKTEFLMWMLINSIFSVFTELLVIDMQATLLSKRTF